MMLKAILILSVLGWSVGGAAQPEVREPTAKWVVNFADAQCIASRAYGSSENPLHLILKAPPLGEVMQVAVVTKGSWPESRQVEANIRVDDGAPLATTMLMFSPPKNNTRVYMMNMPANDFSLVRQAGRLSIRSQGLDETFALSQMEPLLRVVDRCVADLRNVWNIGDPQGAQSVLADRASANMARLFDDTDYPTVALDQGKSGTVRFAVLIDETGRVSDCTIIETSGVAALDAQTCFVVKDRGRFRPARGLDGKPAKDAAIQLVRWKVGG